MLVLNYEFTLIISYITITLIRLFEVLYKFTKHFRLCTVRKDNIINMYSYGRKMKITVIIF